LQSRPAWAASTAIHCYRRGLNILADMSAAELPMDGADAIFADRLPWEHRDPFDRMIVAQAARRHLTIATSDARILAAALTPTLKT
jgi:PIN domain nuclease of toxin-antitoxin system